MSVRVVSFGPKRRKVYASGTLVGVAQWDSAKGAWCLVDHVDALQGVAACRYDSRAELGTAVAAGLARPSRDLREKTGAAPPRVLAVDPDDMEGGSR